MKSDTILFQLKKLTQLMLNEIETNNEKQTQDIPISTTQIRIICYMIEHDNKVLQKELENALGISRSTVSDVLKTMEKYDLIERTASDIDTRTNQIILKEKAIEKIKNCKKSIMKISDDMYENISEEEIELFKIILDKMIKNLEEKRGLNVRN